MCSSTMLACLMAASSTIRPGGVISYILLLPSAVDVINPFLTSDYNAGYIDPGDGLQSAEVIRSISLMSA